MVQKVLRNLKEIIAQCEVKITHGKNLGIAFYYIHHSYTLLFYVQVLPTAHDEPGHVTIDIVVEKEVCNDIQA